MHKAGAYRIGCCQCSYIWWVLCLSGLQVYTVSVTKDVVLQKLQMKLSICSMLLLI